VKGRSCSNPSRPESGRYAPPDTFRSLSFARREAWAARCQRIVDYVPGRRGETDSVIAALNVEGVHAPFCFRCDEHGCNARMGAQPLAPLLEPRRHRDLGHLGIHQDAEVSMYIRASGARREFLPADSPVSTR